jgi:AcrR family transcriptional regulator
VSGKNGTFRDSRPRLSRIEGQARMNDESSVDRRVERTQTALRSALLELVLERGWDEVSVQAVCARAQVGRSTFYAHYADKEELLLSGFEGLSRELRTHVRRAGSDRLAFVGPLVSHVSAHRRLFRALAGTRTARKVERRMLDVICSLLELPPASELRSAAARYAAGACVELLTYWLDERSGLGARDVTRLFRQLTSALVRETERAVS